MFNISTNNCLMIPLMKKEAKSISEQMQRLYAAAWDLKQIKGKSALGRLLDVLPQNINNWENGRPISSEALLAAQEKIGCDAIWLRDGTGEMIRAGATEVSNISDVVLLVNLYEQSNANGRSFILDSARGAEKTAPKRTGKSSPNKP